MLQGIYFRNSVTISIRLNVRAVCKQNVRTFVVVQLKRLNRQKLRKLFNKLELNWIQRQQGEHVFQLALEVTASFSRRAKSK